LRASPWFPQRLPAHAAWSAIRSERRPGRPSDGSPTARRRVLLSDACGCWLARGQCHVQDRMWHRRMSTPVWRCAARDVRVAQPLAMSRIRSAWSKAASIGGRDVRLAHRRRTTTPPRGRSGRCPAADESRICAPDPAPWLRTACRLAFADVRYVNSSSRMWSAPGYRRPRCTVGGSSDFTRITLFAYAALRPAWCGNADRHWRHSQGAHHGRGCATRDALAEDDDGRPHGPSAAISMRWQ
jgi:hypothetical protein